MNAKDEHEYSEELLMTKNMNTKNNLEKSSRTWSNSLMTQQMKA